MVIALIGDICTAFPTNLEAKKRATLPYVEKSILELKGSSNNEYKETADYTLGAIKAILQ